MRSCLSNGRALKGNDFLIRQYISAASRSGGQAGGERGEGGHWALRRHWLMGGGYDLCHPSGQPQREGPEEWAASIRNSKSVSGEYSGCKSRGITSLRREGCKIKFSGGLWLRKLKRSASVRICECVWWFMNALRMQSSSFGGRSYSILFSSLFLVQGLGGRGSFKVTTLREYRSTRIELLKRGIFFSLSLELPCIPRLKVASSITGSSGFLARSSEVAMYQKLMRLSVPGIGGLRVPRLWLKGYRRHDDLIPVQSVTRSWHSEVDWREVRCEGQG